MRRVLRRTWSEDFLPRRCRHPTKWQQIKAYRAAFTKREAPVNLFTGIFQFWDVNSSSSGYSRNIEMFRSEVKSAADGKAERSSVNVLQYAKSARHRRVSVVQACDPIIVFRPCYYCVPALLCLRRFKFLHVRVFFCWRHAHPWQSL